MNLKVIAISDSMHQSSKNPQDVVGNSSADPAPLIDGLFVAGYAYNKVPAIVDNVKCLATGAFEFVIGVGEYFLSFFQFGLPVSFPVHHSSVEPLDILESRCDAI